MFYLLIGGGFGNLLTKERESRSIILIRALSPPHMMTLFKISMLVVFAIIKSMHFSSFSSFSERFTRQSKPSDDNNNTYDCQKQTSTNYLVANFLFKLIFLPERIQCYSSLTLFKSPGISVFANGQILQFPRPIVTRLTGNCFVLAFRRVSSCINLMAFMGLLFLFWVSRSPVEQSQTNMLPSLLLMVTMNLESGEKRA